MRRQKKDIEQVQLQKRALIIHAFSWMAGLGILSLGLPLRRVVAQHRADIGNTRLLVTPPGSMGFDHFTATCIACQACVSACPEKVLLPSTYRLLPDTAHIPPADRAEDENSGRRHGRDQWVLAAQFALFQPHLDFSTSRCAYPCNACTSVCPSGAILPLSLKKKQRTRIGEVVFEEKRCVVFKHKRDCGACAEVCPTHAVHTIRKENIHFPKIKANSCIGCGACQLVCPVNPKAIYVKAVRIHEQAAEPFFHKKEKDTHSKVMGNEDEFPF